MFIYEYYQDIIQSELRIHESLESFHYMLVSSQSGVPTRLGHNHRRVGSSRFSMVRYADAMGQGQQSHVSVVATTQPVCPCSFKNLPMGSVQAYPCPRASSRTLHSQLSIGSDPRCRHTHERSSLLFSVLEAPHVSIHYEWVLRRERRSPVVLQVFLRGGYPS
jgi:hypothetical protein